MIPVLTRDQIRAYDTRAIEHCHVPGLILMENAGIGAVREIEAILSTCAPSGPVVVVCGAGNNGGDGFVVARHLAARGRGVQVLLAANAAKLRGDARANHDAYVGLGGVVMNCAAELTPLRSALAGAVVVVDALFGTGLDRPVEGHLAGVIDEINRAKAPRVSLDIPSGIDCDTGRVLGAAVRADSTITFAHLKPGLLAGEGAVHSGRVSCAPLGIADAALLEEVGWRAEVITAQAVAATLGERAPDAHKYRAGSVLVVAGSPGKVGAALLCGRAALRAGAGIVSIGTSPQAADALDVQVAELMTTRLGSATLEADLACALAKRDAVAIGPGLGFDADARGLVERVVLGFDGPVVVDADALAAFAGRAGELRGAPGPRILTPHEGELAKLLGTSAAVVAADRFGAAAEGSRLSGATVVLKGRNSLVAAPDGGIFVCRAGSAVLATAGSGDVLAGIVGAFACIAPPTAAACAAVFVHALAADLWRGRTRADRGLVASDLIALLPGALARVQRSAPTGIAEAPALA